MCSLRKLEWRYLVMLNISDLRLCPRHTYHSQVRVMVECLEKNAGSYTGFHYHEGTRCPRSVSCNTSAYSGYYVSLTVRFCLSSKLPIYTLLYFSNTINVQIRNRQWPFLRTIWRSPSPTRRWWTGAASKLGAAYRYWFWGFFGLKQIKISEMPVRSMGVGQRGDRRGYFVATAPEGCFACIFLSNRDGVR